MLSSELIVESGIAAGSELLIGGLDEVIGADDEGAGGDRDDTPDDETPWVILWMVIVFIPDNVVGGSGIEVVVTLSTAPLGIEVISCTLLEG